MNFEKYPHKTLQQQFDNAKEIYQHYVAKLANEGKLTPNSVWILSDKCKCYYVGVIDFNPKNIKNCTKAFAYYSLRVFDCYQDKPEKECIGKIDFLAYTRTSFSTNFDHAYISSLRIEKDFLNRGLSHSMLNQVMDFLINDKGIKENIEILAHGIHLTALKPRADYSECIDYATRLVDIYSKHGMRVKSESDDSIRFEMCFDKNAERRQSVTCEIEDMTVHTAYYRDRNM